MVEFGWKHLQACVGFVQRCAHSDSARDFDLLLHVVKVAGTRTGVLATQARV